MMCFLASSASGGAGLARRLGRTAVRRIVVAIGFGMALSLFIKFLSKN